MFWNLVQRRGEIFDSFRTWRVLCCSYTCVVSVAVTVSVCSFITVLAVVVGICVHSSHLCTCVPLCLPLCIIQLLVLNYPEGVGISDGTGTTALEYAGEKRKW